MSKDPATEPFRLKEGPWSVAKLLTENHVNHKVLALSAWKLPEHAKYVVLTHATH